MFTQYFYLVLNVYLYKFCRAIKPHTMPHPYAYISDITLKLVLQEGIAQHNPFNSIE